MPSSFPKTRRRWQRKARLRALRLGGVRVALRRARARAILSAPIVQGLGNALAFAWFVWLGVPSFAMRASLLIVVELAILTLFALANRRRAARRD